MVVEGVATAEACYSLAEKYGVEMPISNAIYHVIHGDISAKSAVDILMGREKKNEMTI